MACNPFSIKRTSSNCTENFAGVGARVLVALVEDLSAPAEWSEELAGFTPDSFTFKEGKGFSELDIKKKSGKVTFESNGQNKGFSNVLTFIVDHNMERMAYLARIVNNVDCIWMVADGKGGWYTLYDPDFSTEISISGDTGDTPDSDSGITVTVTGSPMRYGFAKWSGTPTIVESEADVTNL